MEFETHQITEVKKQPFDIETEQFTGPIRQAHLYRRIATLF